MSKAVSPYYPPRARWYAPLRRGGSSVSRLLALDWLRRPQGVSLRALLLSLLIPGLGFYLGGRRLWARAAFLGCLVLLVVFVVELGHTAANIAFGLVISLHAAGVSVLLEPWFLNSSFRARLLWSLAILIALAGLLYTPARRFVDNHWLTPLELNGRVVIVKKYGGPRHLRRGDWIAYSLPAVDYYTRAGFGLGPVLALPGDFVRFTPEALEVNGASRPRALTMPGSGELAVPQKHWFIWPEFDIAGHGNAPEAVSQAILRSATISEEQFVGRPFTRWFWRRQVFP